MTPSALPDPPPPGFLRRALRFLKALRAMPAQLAHYQQRIAALEARGDWLEQRLQSRLDWLEQNHRANIEWLQQTYPEIVTAIGQKIEQEQLQAFSEKLFAALYRELADVQKSAVPATENPSGNPSVAASRFVPLGALGPVDDDFYLDLEKQFRGTRAELQRRLQPYLDFLQTRTIPAGTFVDLGCGRGEWLELLARHHIDAEGVDLNPINGAACRQAGLKVVTDFAENYLQRQPANSLAGISAFQLVEHLEFTSLQKLIELSLGALKPGGVLILETPNPENLQVAGHTFWIDPTHQRPLPPALLEFMVRRQGFEQTSILRLNPCENYNPAAPEADSQRLLEADSQRLLYGPRDYAILARKPETPPRPPENP